MATKPPTKTESSKTEHSAKSVEPPEKSSPSKSKTDHPAAEGIPLPLDPSAVHLQEEQDELQQPGRVARATADQVDNDPGYSKDQLAHMNEYWSHDGAVGEEIVPEPVDVDPVVETTE